MIKRNNYRLVDDLATPVVTGSFNNPDTPPFNMTHVLPNAVRKYGLRSYSNCRISLKHTLKLCADRSHCVILFLNRQQKTVDILIWHQLVSSMLHKMQKDCR